MPNPDGTLTAEDYAEINRLAAAGQMTPEMWAEVQRRGNLGAQIQQQNYNLQLQQGGIDAQTQANNNAWLQQQGYLAQQQQGDYLQQQQAGYIQQQADADRARGFSTTSPVMSNGTVNPSYITQGLGTATEALPVGNTTLGQFADQTRTNEAVSALQPHIDSVRSGLAPLASGQQSAALWNALPAPTVAPPTLVNPTDVWKAVGTPSTVAPPGIPAAPTLKAPYGAGSATQAAAMKALAPFITGDVGDVGSSPTMKAAVAAWNQNVLPVVQQQMQLAGLGRSAATADAAGESLTTAMLPLIQQDYANRLAAAGQVGNLYGTEAGLAGNLFGSEAGLAGNVYGAQAGLTGSLYNTQAQQGSQNYATQAGLASNLFNSANQTAANMYGTQAGLAGNTYNTQAQLGLGLGQQQLGALQQQGNLLNNEGQLRLGLGGQSLQAGQSLQQGGLNAYSGLQQGQQIENKALTDLGQYIQQQQQNALTASGQAGQAQQSVQQGGLDAAAADFLRRQSLGEASSTGLFGGSVLPKTLNVSTGTSGGK